MSENNLYKTSSFKQILESTDVVCLSHLRWDFVYQRPQHLLSRFARRQRVFYVEEPVFTDEATHLEVSLREDNLRVVVPHLHHEDAANETPEALQRNLLQQFMADQRIADYVLWYYTPMALAFSSDWQPRATVYDCMDELSAFRFAPPQLLAYEEELFRRADLVFTGGPSLYEAKRYRHPQVFAFPSSIDAEHFAQARTIAIEAPEQAELPRPRIGFFGVLDERFDLELLRDISQLRPDWQFILLGPIVKISPDDLPQADNVHYLGAKSYASLPLYLAGWDVAMMPFAINDATRYISPTKTPEYLAAGQPVVSTPIQDVVNLYGEKGLVHIAATSVQFIEAIEAALNPSDRQAEIAAADEFLAQISWDKTWQEMAEKIAGVLTAGKAQAV